MKFFPNEFYHVYNRGNNKQLIFNENENYRYFLQKIQSELTDCADILAYCLMPNHYHLLMYTYPDFSEHQSTVLSRKLGTLQSSYAQAYNKRYNFSGSLFQQKFKGKCLNKDSDQALICFHYIHQNPLKAGFVKKMEDWKFSSYREYLNCKNSKLLQMKLAFELLGIPESKEAFEKESLGIIVFDQVIKIF